MKALMISILSLCMAGTSVQAQLGDVWLEKQSKHFNVRYNFDHDRSLALRVLREAEKYYDSIGDLLGYTKYHSFWTWEDRVNVVIYPDQFSFVQFTGQPVWSRGYASDHSRLFQSKAIVTFKQESLFREDILPHEISHLLLHDYLGFGRFIPIWFDEGIAQLQQQSRQQPVKQLMKQVVAKQNHIPFKVMMSLDIRKEKDEQKVIIFYSQSLSVVQFMIQKFGRSSFQRLLREMKNGMDLQKALLKVYRPYFSSIQEFEEKWLQYAKSGF